MNNPQTTIEELASSGASLTLTEAETGAGALTFPILPVAWLVRFDDRLFALLYCRGLATGQQHDLLIDGAEVVDEGAVAFLRGGRRVGLLQATAFGEEFLDEIRQEAGQPGHELSIEQARRILETFEAELVEQIRGEDG